MNVILENLSPEEVRALAHIIASKGENWTPQNLDPNAKALSSLLDQLLSKTNQDGK